MSEPIAAPAINEDKMRVLIGKVDDIDARPGAGMRAFRALADDGSFIIVEPMTGRFPVLQRLTAPRILSR